MDGHRVHVRLGFMLLVKTKLNLSKIHGVGLFADEFVPRDTVIWRFNPVIDIKFPEEALGELSAGARDQIQKYSYREIGSRLYVLCGDDARFFNHSSDPNCIDICGGPAGDVTISKRDIAAGEELTCDYSLFDLDLIEGRYSMSGPPVTAQPVQAPPLPIPAP